MEDFEMLRTDLTRMFGTRHPIVCAPMAGWSGGRLAGAVSAGGGLGMIAAGSATSRDSIVSEAEIARPHGPFGFGLMTWSLESRPELLDCVLAQEPDAVSLSFGDPSPYVERCQEAGAKVLCQVQDRETALQAANAGADVLVAQGTDAGGHTGSVGTMPLLQIVLALGEEVGIPVLAAGGIGSGRALAGVLAMGGAGVWIGTRFCATEQSLGSEAQKRQILAAGESDTVYTSVFDIVLGIPWPEEFGGRAIRNDFSERWHGREAELKEEAETARPRFDEAMRSEDYSEAYIYTGQVAGLIDEMPDAGELVGKLSEEAESHLAAVRKLTSP